MAYTKQKLQEELRMSYPDAQAIEVHTLHEDVYAVEVWHDVETEDVERFFMSVRPHRYGEPSA